MYSVRVGGTVDIAINSAETALMPAAVTIYEYGYTALQTKHGLGACWGEFTWEGGERCLLLHLHHVKLPWYAALIGASWSDVTSGYYDDVEFGSSMSWVVWDNAHHKPVCMAAHLTLFNLGYNHWMTESKGGICH
jgi:hypothetical protein